LKRAYKIAILVLAVLAAVLVALDAVMYAGIGANTEKRRAEAPKSQTVQQAQLPEQDEEEQLPEIGQEDPSRVEPEASTQEEPKPEEQPEELPAEPEELQGILDAFCQGQEGEWDICVFSLEEDRLLASVQADEPMVSASVIKLFIMAAVYDQVEQGGLSHDSVLQHIRYMITVSDNYSANQLVSKLGGGDTAAGMAAVNAFAASIGCTDSVQNRLMLDNNGLQNYTTAADCVKLLKMIYDGTCVSAEWSAEMLQILKEQTIVSRIPAGLPQGTVCANKTGDLAGLCCADVGIVFAPKGDYILCVICNDYRSEPTPEIADLSRQVYEYLEA